MVRARSRHLRTAPSVTRSAFPVRFAQSKFVEVNGLEPSTSTLRTELRHLPGLEFLVDPQATLVDEVHQRARKDRGRAAVESC